MKTILKGQISHSDLHFSQKDFFYSLNDPVKASLNLKNHKVSFEERWLMFGLSRMARILTISYTHRRGKYRIISARLATRNERKIYETG